jgi:hypothetical protein
VTPRLPAIAFRLLVLVSVWLLGTSTLSLAQEDPTPEVTETQAPAVDPVAAAAEAEDDGLLLVPDVRGMPYVFAKGVLEDSGFAWKVKGKVEGFAVNLVVEQSVKPATKVLDTGAPTIVLTLGKNPDYEETGLPDNDSPYPGTKVVLADGGTPEPASLPETGEDDQAGADESATDDGSAADDGSGAETSTEPTDTGATETEPADTTATEPADTTGDGEAAGATEVDVNVDADVEVTVDARPPAFVVKGAPKEPLDEMPLPDRARKLAKWAAGLAKLTPAALDHYTYQHAWVVTGAKFGWWHGDEALRILIQVDKQMQQTFHVGGKYEATARAALAEVTRKSKEAK